jgi:hypothetical protein
MAVTAFVQRCCDRFHIELVDFSLAQLDRQGIDHGEKPKRNVIPYTFLSNRTAPYRLGWEIGRFDWFLQPNWWGAFYCSVR